jgi:hypothetical protein
MKCPHCGHNRNRVTETRARDDGDLRRHHCLHCAKTFQSIARICVYAGRATGYIEAAQPLATVTATPEPEPIKAPAEPTPAKPRVNNRRWHPIAVPHGVCDEAAPLMLEWWNESRRHKQGGKAVWTERAWLESVARVAQLPAAQQVQLCRAGVEFGWQALKSEYLGNKSEPTVRTDGRLLPQDPRLLEAIRLEHEAEDLWPAAS